MNFQYYSPTRICFGSGEETSVGSIIKGYGFKRVLMVYGRSSIKKTGLYDVVMTSLQNAGLAVCELGGVEANPKIALIREGVALAKKEKTDIILAVGGGSVIDTAKSIACGAKVDFDPWLFTTHEKAPLSALPIGVILTLSATGSELSNSCVVSDLSVPFKNGFNSDLIRPLFAIESPRLTASVSPFQTGCGVVDILMHTLERYLTDKAPLALADAFAEGLMRCVMAYGPLALREPANEEARANLMLASSFSHNGLTGMGGVMYFTVHKLEHQLSATYDEVAHGAGLSVLFPAWANHVMPRDPKRFASFARRVMAVTLDDDLAAGREGIRRLEAFFKSLPMPTRLPELGITVSREDIERMASRLTNGGTTTVAGLVPLTMEDIKAIFTAAL